jgi:uncharacterized protein YmfQ (DUF2313 family)
MEESQIPTCIEEEGFWGEEWGGFWSNGVSGCLEIIKEYYPPGLAWPRDQCTWLERLQNAFAHVICEARATIQEMLDVQMFPATTTWLLEDYEKWLKLPGPCYTPVTIVERQAAVIAKMVGWWFYPSQENLQIVAEALGCDEVEFIHIGYGSYVGDEVGDFLMGPSWANTWLIKYKSGPWNALLECTFNQLKPEDIDLMFEPY